MKRKYASSVIIPVRYHEDELIILDILRGKESRSVYIRRKSLGGEYIEEVDNPSYNTVHVWINRKFGKADLCENKNGSLLNFNCIDKYKKYEWAKIREKEYTRNKEDYYKLCINCHRKYDSKSYGLDKNGLSIRS